MKHEAALWLCCGAAGVLLGRFIPFSTSQITRPAAAGPVEAVSSDPAKVAEQVPAPVDLRKRPSQPGMGALWDFLQLVSAASPEEFPALWATLPPPPRGDFFGSIRHLYLLETWTEKDPLAALAFVDGLPGDDGSLRRTVFTSWVLTDPEAAFAMLAAQDTEDKRGSAVAGILAAVKDDPLQFIAFAKRMAGTGETGLDEQDVSRFLSDGHLVRLLQADRAGAYEASVSLPAWFRSKLEAVEVVHLASTDLPAALAILRNSAESFAGERYLMECLGELAKTKPAAALAMLTAAGPAAEAGNVRLADPHGVNVLLLKHLMSIDPAKAVEFAEENLRTSQRLAAGNELLNALASNPAAALAFAPALSIGDAGQFRPVAAPNRQAALDALPAAPASLLRNGLLMTTIREWAAESQEQARTWVDALPEGELRDLAIMTLDNPGIHMDLIDLGLQVGFNKPQGGGVLYQSPFENSEPDRKSITAAKDAFTLFSKAVVADAVKTREIIVGMPEGDFRTMGLYFAGRELAEFSPEGALAWAGRFSDAADQVHAVSGIFDSWGEHEPRAASELLASMPEGPLRQAAVISFIDRITLLDHDAALMWVETLTDPAIRTSMMNKVLSRWELEAPAGPVSGQDGAAPVIID